VSQHRDKPKSEEPSILGKDSLDYRGGVSWTSREKIVRGIKWEFCGVSIRLAGRKNGPAGTSEKESFRAQEMRMGREPAREGFDIEE